MPIRAQDLGLLGPAGLTYCAIATLSLLGQIPANARQKSLRCDEQTISFGDNVRWLLERQTTQLADNTDDEVSEGASDMLGPAEGDSFEEGEERPQYAGFSGRMNKIADTCYCFWVGGSLAV